MQQRMFQSNRSTNKDGPKARLQSLAHPTSLTLGCTGLSRQKGGGGTGGKGKLLTWYSCILYANLSAALSSDVMAGPYRLKRMKASWSVMTHLPSRSIDSSSSWVNLQHQPNI